MQSQFGVQVSDGFTHADTSGGFSTGDQLTLDPGLFESFYNQALEISEQYTQASLQTEFPCQSDPDSSCHSNTINGFAEKAYRRPLTSNEQQGLMALFTELRNNPTVNDREALRLTFARVLVSIPFLYRTEIGASGAGLFEMTNFEKASYISYSLTGHPPDEELYEDAKKADLTAEQIRYHVDRLLRTSQGKNQLTAFFQQWLMVDNLNNMKNNPQAFPKIESADLAQGLSAEFESFIESLVIDRQGNLLDLLLNETTFINRSTASIYGLNSSSAQMEEVPLQGRRRGILTLASVMAVHSSEVDPGVDSPVSRGILINRQILCNQVGFPSGLDINSAQDNIAQEHPDFESYTVRRQYETVMNQDRTCVSCHSQFMPYGYMFSNFDALGNFSNNQNARTIDSRAEAPINNQEYQDVYDFLPTLANNSQYHQCFATKLATFLTGNAGEAKESRPGFQMNSHLQNQNLSILPALREYFANPETYLRRRE